MKKILTAIAISALALTFPAYADNVKYDILNVYKPGGVFYKVRENLEAEGNLWSGNTIDLGSCAEGANYLKNTDRPTIAAWTLFDGLTNENDPCATMLTADTFVTFYGNTYFKMCSSVNRPEHDLQHFLKGDNVKIGVYNSLPTITMATEIVKGIGNPNAKVIPYKNSGVYMAALEVGEINYVMTTRWRDGLECVLSGDPNDPELAKTSDYYNGPWSTPDYAIVIIGVNIDEDLAKLIKDDIVNTTKSELWTSGSSAGYANTVAVLPRAEQWIKLDELQRSYLESINN